MKKLIFLLVVNLFFWGCEQEKPSDLVNYSTIRGNTMGTTYSIVFKDADKQAEAIKKEIDSILVALNQEVSTYIPASVISRINEDESLSIDLLALVENDSSLCEHFIKNFQKAKALYKRTETYLDPTVMPLINYWGFGYQGRAKIESVDSLRIKELLELVDFSKFKLDDYELKRSNGAMQLDFSAVAKGYGVDLVGIYLESIGVKDYLIEIGGEMLGSGKNATNVFWKVGINTPKEGAATNAYDVIVSLENKALATSGNYRIFYENEDGARFAHIINPKSGYSEQSRLLSVSVFAPDCATADGFATGFMTMGLDQSVEKVEQVDSIEAAFIYVNDKEELEVAYSSGLKEEILMDKTKTKE